MGFFLQDCGAVTSFDLGSPADSLTPKHVKSLPLGLFQESFHVHSGSRHGIVVRALVWLGG